jgi:hypothetical protein
MMRPPIEVADIIRAAGKNFIEGKIVDIHCLRI